MPENPSHGHGEPLLSGPPPVIGGEVRGGNVVVGDDPVVVVVGGAVVVVVGAVVVVVATVVVVVGAVVVVVPVAALQTEEVIVLPARVTPPFRARARPCSVAPVSIEIDVRARMLPTIAVVEPMVAELPTCQNTLHGCTPPVSTTLLPGPVMSVLTLWKIKTELALPAKVKVPVNESPELAAYTPGESVWPPRSVFIDAVAGALSAAR